MLTEEQLKKAILQGKKYGIVEYFWGISIVWLKDDITYDGIMLGEWELVITKYDSTKIFTDEYVEVSKIVEMIDENGFYNWIFENSLVDDKIYS